MKTRLFTALLSTTVLFAGAVRLGAQAKNDQYDAYFSLNLVGQAYRDAADREKAILASLTAAHYDVNHDGKLDAREQAAWEKRIRTVLETNAKFMKQFDRNRNGVLSDAEWAAAYTEVFEPKAPAPAGSAD